ncbi:hypothetical protein GCM10016234_02990 [Tianweitania populi]|uniref:Uncharacterized protein n=1 Tax=Tianweitania populi TaxID=1607949 RepID=A0A8J3GI53_9HYPH|nr:hypothetical protein GCM10016234_02990 [Tianweitania populi]
MGRLVDMGNDDVTVPGGGDSLGGLARAEQRTAITIQGIAGDLQSQRVNLADRALAVFRSRTAKPARMRDAGSNQGIRPALHFHLHRFG